MLMLLAHTPDRSNYKAMQRRPDAFARAMYFPEWDPPDLERLWQKAYPDVKREQVLCMLVCCLFKRFCSYNKLMSTASRANAVH